MLARRAFLTTALTAIASGILAAPGLAVGQGSPADQPSGPSTGSPRARGRSRGLPSNTQEASAPRASGSPSSRGQRRATDRAGAQPPSATVINVADEAEDDTDSRASRRRDTATLR
jgi:hypothetical protein